MKEPFNKRKLLVVAILVTAVVLVVLISSFFLKGVANPVSNLLGYIYRPFQSVVAGAGQKIADAYGYLHAFDELKMENAQLRITIAQMEEKIRISESANEENQRLRELLDFAQRRRDLETESAMIVAWTSTNWASLFTINRGSQFGFEPYDCVIDQQGNFVGFLSEVGPNWATVTTLIDTDMEAGATVFRTDEIGVAEGNFDLMRRGLLQLSYLPKDIDLQNGDVILTSGIGEVFPRDLVLGVVERVTLAETGISAVAQVKPATDLTSLTQVFIVKSFAITD